MPVRITGAAEAWDCQLKAGGDGENVRPVARDGPQAGKTSMGREGNGGIGQLVFVRRIALVSSRHFEFAIPYTDGGDAFLEFGGIGRVGKNVDDVACLDFSRRYSHGDQCFAS